MKSAGTGSVPRDILKTPINTEARNEEG